MSVFAVGLNHVTAPIDLRARFAVSAAQLAPTLQSFVQRVRGATEAAMVSTCNRTELYVGAAQALIEPARDWLAELGGVDRRTLEEHTYLLEDESAARHAFRVASGLDSMVLGEPQVLGQLKVAVREAESAGTLGSTLHQMFQRSFAVAKEVRSRTEIGAHSVSMASACVRMASQLFEDLSQTRILCVGAGDMIELTATHFAARGPRELRVASRTLERAQALAARFGGQGMPLADVPDSLADFDIVISCTASSVPIIGLGAIERALRIRRRRPMFIVDLAVPRDVELEVARLPDVYLYNVDDIAGWVQTGGDKRQAAVQHAEAIIESGVHGFVDWLDQRGTVPLIRALHDQADAWRRIEVTRAHRLLARGQDIESVLESMTHALTQKMLHGPVSALRRVTPAERPALSQSLKKLLLDRQHH